MSFILCFVNFLKRVFSIKGWWVIFPFALVGLVFAGLFFIFSPLYMLYDFARVSVKKLLYNDNENLSAAAQFVKFLIAFGMYALLYGLTILFSCLLAIGYFLAFCSFFISSAFRLRENPFAFHSVAIE